MGSQKSSRERKDFEITWSIILFYRERILKSREGERDEQNHSKGSGLTTWEEFVTK